MPVIDLPESDLRLSWRSNLPNDDLSQLRSSPKPVLLLLNPLFLSVDFLWPQFQDPLLSASFNMIAFNSIFVADTECPTYLQDPKKAPYHDFWVEAALIAQVARALDLPPFHIVASQIPGVMSALRFSILFPEMCLSLVLAGIPGDTDPDWLTEAYGQSVQAIQKAETLEDLEEPLAGWCYLMFNETATEVEFDRVMEYLVQNYNPSVCSRVIGTGTPIITRAPLSPKELARVNVPTLILHGSESVIHPPECAKDLHSALTGVPGGEPSIEILPGGPDNVLFTARSSRYVNRVMSGFLVSSHDPSRLRADSKCTEDTLRRGLEIQAELSGDSSYAKMDSRNIWNYSRAPESARRFVNEQVIPNALAAEATGRSFLAADGKVMRKYSERHQTSLLAWSGVQAAL